MRVISIGVVVLSLAVAAPVAAKDQKETATRLLAANTTTTPAKAGAVRPNSAPALKSAVKPEAAKPVNNASAPAKEPSAVEVELQLLRQLLDEQKRELEAQRTLLKQQQEKMNAMERHMNGPAAAPASASAEVNEEGQNGRPVTEEQLEAVAESLKAATDRVGKVEKDVTANKTQADGKLRQIGNFTFSGDFRGRFESFNGGTLAPGTARFRERFRLRFNVNAKFSDEFTGGLTLASGDINDPVSTNQSMTTFYQRKIIAIGKAFLVYTPDWFKRAFHNKATLSITGGKFGYTWYRTELTWDNDLNVEGISPTISIPIKTSVLKQINLVGFVLPFFEVSGGRDSYMSGGQVQTQWQMGSRIRSNFNVGFMDFAGADRIRAAQANLTSSVTGGGCTTTPGCTTTIPNSNVLGGNANSNSSSATQFASGFGLLNAQLRFDVNTGVARWPLMLQLDYVNNTRACTNTTSTGAPVTPTSNGACNPRARNGYWAEMQWGRNSEGRDVQFGYTFMRIEREAVLSTFNFSDLRTPTNGLTHRINAAYTLNRNITLGWTGFFGRQLVTASSTTQEPILKRMQLDFIYKF